MLNFSLLSEAHTHKALDHLILGSNSRYTQEVRSHEIPIQPTLLCTSAITRLNGLLRNMHPSAQSSKSLSLVDPTAARAAGWPVRVWVPRSRPAGLRTRPGAPRAHFQGTQGDASTKYAGQRWPHHNAVSLILKASICRAST